MVDSISPERLYDRIEAGDRVDLLDLRDREEYETWRITGANVYSARISGSKAVAATVDGTLPDLLAETDLREPIVVVCPRGEQSAAIAASLDDAGVVAMNLDNGMRGWARLLIDRPIDAVSGAVQFERPSSGCLSYLLVDDGEAAVIDPLRAFTDRYVDTAADRGVSLQWAVDTHVHADHVSGVRALAEASGATPVLPAGATDRGLEFQAHQVEDGDHLPVGQRSLEAEAAPGHTGESHVFQWGDLLCTGDTLFVDGVGRPDLEGGTDRARAFATRLYETLTDTLLTKPDETIIGPGHTSERRVRATDGTVTATLGTVEDRLGVVNEDVDAFLAQVTESLPPRPANYERIVAINLGKETVDADTAFELELGPNNCAVAPDLQA